MFFIQKSIKPEAASLLALVFFCLLLSGKQAIADSQRFGHHGHRDSHEGYWYDDDSHDHRYHEDNYRDRYDRRYDRYTDRHYDRRSDRRYEKRKAKRQKIKDRRIKRRLKRHFNRWEGTPYRYGGHSWRGVDCSGFVSITYRQLFDIRLPRSSRAMLKRGKKVRKRHLRPGDLVFFREGRHNWHVGIYLNNDRFMHASNSKGVTISSLHSPYWKRHYHSARKIL